ncbi:MAG: hypothetical protein ACYTG6_12550, partial [Planctomycetota bacterium]
MRRVVLLCALLCPLAAASGCLARPDHPVTHSAISAPAVSPAAAQVPEPPPPAGPGARRALFAGFADVDGPLAFLRGRGSPPGGIPRLQRLARMEQSVRQRTRHGTALGRVRHVSACGFSGYAPLPPRAMADIIGSPVAERHALGAETFRPAGIAYALPDFARRLYRVELLNRGEGPFRFDLRFTTALERWDLADGSVLFRYDPLPVPVPEHITLYRGACQIEAAPGGCRVTEFLVLGTDISVPFFLEGSMRELVYDTFEIRITRLWRL